MKNSVTEYIIALFELVEAEVGAMKQSVFKLMTAVILLGVAAVTLIAGVALLTWGFYHFYNTMMVGYLASFATAATLFVLAWLIIVYVRWRH